MDEYDEICREAAEELDRHQRNPGGQHDGWWACMCGKPHSGAHLIGVLNDASFVVSR